MNYEKLMKSFCKNTVKGLILFGMTLSFILAPIPRISLVWAEEAGSESGCWSEGDSGSERIYRPNCEMSNIVQKSQLSKHTGHQSSFASVMEQAVAGMMAVVLIQSLRYKYLHELEAGTVYGNDCPQNKAGKWSIRVAQLGALAYLVGDIKANMNFQKSSKKATDSAFGSSSTGRKGSKSEQLRTFETLIEVLEAQKKGIKTKMVLSSMSQAAYLASLGIDLFGITSCNAVCGSEVALQKAKLTEFEFFMKAAISAAVVESAIPASLCKPAVGALTAFHTLATTSNGLKITKDIAESEANRAKKLASSGVWAGVFGSVSSLMAEMALGQIKEIINTPVETVEDSAALANISKSQGELSAFESKDGTAIGAVVAASQGCTGSRVPIAAALSAYVNYVYTPVKCCGGPGLSTPIQAQLIAGHETLKGTIATLQPGEHAKNYAELMARTAKTEAEVKAFDKGVGAIADNIMSSIANGMLPLGDLAVEVVKPEIAAGTIAGMGQPQVSQFGSTKDIRVLGLLSGLFSSNKEKEELEKYVKSQFESMLRRIAISQQLSSFNPSNPKVELEKISELNQKINNIMFFFDQMINEKGIEDALAKGEFKKHRYWPSIVEMISDLVIPKAHALGFLGNMAASAGAGVGLSIIQKEIGTKGPWDEILNVGSQFMMVNALLSKIAKSYGFVKPKGRVITWSLMNVVNGSVLAIDSNANKKIDEYIEIIEAEKERYQNAVGIGGVKGNLDGEGNTDNGKLVANIGDVTGREVVNGQANIRRCATPNGQGFLPAPCPMKVNGSAFDPPKISTDFASGLTPSHLSTMKNISNISRGLATGSMGADDLASMDLDSWQSANNAMRAFNEKLIKKIDAADKKRFKDSDVKPTPLQEMLYDAKKAFSGGTSAPALASLSPNKSKLNAKGESTKDKKENEAGFTKTNPYGDGSATGASSNGKDEFDFGLSEGGIETEKREVAVNAEKSLDDFVINHDDINKRKDVSIFKILSNRYLLSYPKVLEEK